MIGLISVIRRKKDACHYVTLDKGCDRFLRFSVFFLLILRLMNNKDRMMITSA